MPDQEDVRYRIQYNDGNCTGFVTWRDEFYEIPGKESALKRALDRKNLLEKDNTDFIWRVVKVIWTQKEEVVG